MATIPIEHTQWRATGRRQDLVVVRRVEHDPDQGWTVHARPITGGRTRVTSARWFIAHHEAAPAR
jgi:hypothetical protein